MSYHFKIKPAELVLVDTDPNADAVLLRALYRLWPEGKFDASSISGNVWNQPQLKLALRFLDPKYGPGGYLTARATQRVRRWIDAVENRPAGGLMLVRDRIGWCDIVGVGMSAREKALAAAVDQLLAGIADVAVLLARLEGAGGCARLVGAIRARLATTLPPVPGRPLPAVWAEAAERVMARGGP